MYGQYQKLLIILVPHQSNDCCYPNKSLMHGQICYFDRVPQFSATFDADFTCEHFVMISTPLYRVAMRIGNRWRSHACKKGSRKNYILSYVEKCYEAY